MNPRTAEVALRDSEKRFRSLVLASSQMVWTTDARGQVVGPLPSWQDFTGQCDSEILGAGWSAALHPDDLAHTLQVWNRAVETRSLFDTEYRVRRHDGIFRHFAVRGVPVLNEDGSIAEWVGACTDITERKQSEEELRRINRALKAVSSCNQATVRATNEAELLATVCRLIVDVCGYRLAWVGYAERDDLKSVRPVAQAGFEEGYLQSAKITWADTERGRGPTGVAIREKRPCVAQNILSDPAFQPWRAEALKRSYSSSIALPLMVGAEAIGALMIYSEKSESFDDEETKLLKELADDLSFAVQSLRATTERERAEAAVESERQRFYDVLEALPAYVVLLTPDYLVPFANRTFRERFGESHGRRCYEYLFGRSTPCEICETFTVLKTRAPHEWDWTGPDGREYQVFDLPFTTAGGSTLILEMGVDVTERKRAESALQESEIRYRELFLNATLGIFRATVDGTLLEVNPALVRMLGYDSREELLAVNLTTGIYRNPDDRHRLIQYCLEGRLAESNEVEWKRKDGKPIFVRLTGRALRDARGEVGYFEDFVEDITERRALEKQFYAAQKFQAIGQLAGGIAHDFNNVLGAILGWAELSESLVPPESKLRHNLQVIIKQARQATGLTKQLLAVSRRQHMEQRVLDLNASIREVLSMLGTVLGSDIELSTKLAENLASIRADPTQVEQVLMNLCVNARDAMSLGGKLTIETRNAEIDEAYCRRHPYARPGAYVQFSVSDTGVGMDPALMEHIFEPFFTTKEVGKGTGLGLATVYGIVKQHGGFIHVYSEPEQGATFRIYFPACPAPSTQEKNEEATRTSGGKETILFAEDNEDLASFVRAALEQKGYSVLWAPNGEEAVRLFQEHHNEIAMVFLDVVMPGLNGPDAFSKMSALRPNVPALFTSGHTFDAPALRPLVERGTPVLQKPYSVADLLRKVRSILDAHAA